MFGSFEASFTRDLDLSIEPSATAVRHFGGGLDELFREFGGWSVNRGLYRVIDPSTADTWARRVSLAFPRWEHRAHCFGYDWLGRVFAVDAAREATVLMLEPGTREVLEVPRTVAAFHNEELVSFRNAALASDFFDRWCARGGALPRHNQCVGYRIPLFLGGEDEVDNLELSDIDVYWHVLGQLQESAVSPT